MEIDSSGGEEIETICTVCLVELSACVTVYEHPRLKVAVCAECYNQVKEEENWSEVCIWCVDKSEEAATLALCDGGCDTAWCENCLETHLGAEYTKRIFAAENIDDIWQCPKCTGEKCTDEDILASLREKLENGISIHEAMWNRGAEEYLIAIESEIAQAQEQLEDEWLDQRREDIQAEMCKKGGMKLDAVDKEMENLEFLIRRKLDLLLIEQPDAQERAESEGINLAVFYMSKIEVYQQEKCETEVWRNAVSLKSRKRGRVAALCRQDNNDDDQSIHSDDSSCASYEDPTNAEARQAKEKAENDLAIKAPIRKKRGKGGRVDWVGDATGASGYEQKRIQVLGQDIYDKIYQDNPAAATIALRDHPEFLKDANLIDEIDDTWKTSFEKRDVKMIETNEQQLNGTRARIRKKPNDQDISQTKPKPRQPRGRHRPSSNGSIPPFSPASSVAPDSIQKSNESENKRNQSSIDQSGTASSTKKKLDFAPSNDDEPPIKKSKPSIVQARRVPNPLNAKAPLYLPCRFPKKNPPYAEHFILLPEQRNSAYVTLGREATDMNAMRNSDSEFNHFIDVCDSDNIKISRKLGRLEFNKETKGKVALIRNATSKTAIYINGIYLNKHEETRIFTEETTTLTLGKANKKNEIRAGGGHQKSHQQVHAYLLLPTAQGDFSIPQYDPASFEVNVTEIKVKSRSARPGSAEAPILLDDVDDLLGDNNQTKPSSSTAIARSPPQSPNTFRLRKRKDVKEIAINDDNLCQATREAQEQERAKRERLQQRKAKRASNESGEGSQPMIIDDDSDNDIYDPNDQRPVIRLNGDDEEIEVRIPPYLTDCLKEHQIEAARFLYQQTIEDLDTLTNTTDADETKLKTPYGCVLAHSMGLGKSLTCIAYLVSLLRHPVAKRSIKTILVVAPANVVRNWQDEFEKWCKTDRRILDRVRVVDTKISSKAERVRELDEWKKHGGICIIGYDLFNSLVSDSDHSGKRKSKEEKPSESWYQLYNRRAISSGVGVIAAQGSSECADILADGILGYKNKTYKSPAGLALAMIGKSHDAWRRLTYKGTPLMELTRSTTSAIDEAAARRRAEENEIFSNHAKAALLDPGPDVVILDEAHLIKNPKSMKAMALGKIRTRRRVALTGTPLQNNLMEYHTMITYVRGSILGTQKEFKNRFADIINNGMCADSTEDDVKKSRRRTHVLKKKIQGFVLRRDQTLLAKEVEKTEYLVVTKFKPLQRQLYRSLVANHLSHSVSKLLSAFGPAIKIGNNPTTFLFDKDRDHDSEATLSAGTDTALPPTRAVDVSGPPVTNTETTMNARVNAGMNESTVAMDSNDGPDDDPELLTDNILRADTEEAMISKKKKNKRRSSYDIDDDGFIDLVSDDDYDEGEQDDDEDEADKSGGDTSSNDVLIIDPPPTSNVVDMDSEKLQQLGDSNNAVENMKMKPSEGIYREVLTALRQGSLQTTDITKIDVAEAVKLSSKTAILFEIVAKCLQVGDKVVIFSQKLACLNFLEHVLQSKEWVQDRQRIGGIPTTDRDTRPWKSGIDYLRIDGAVAGADRQRMVNNFEQEDSQAKVFLISTQAGNMGITLVQANRIILFDTSWNPATDRQALFRSFRYGQKKHVYVYRLVAQGFEEKIHRRATQKEVLSLRIVDDTACERLYNAAELEGIANLEEDEEEDNEDQEIVDPILFDILDSGKHDVLRYYVTDTLFRENDEERLLENEEAEAEDEYERERTGRPTKAQEQAQVPSQPYSHIPQTTNQLISQSSIQHVVQPTRQPAFSSVVQSIGQPSYQPLHHSPIRVPNQPAHNSISRSPLRSPLTSTQNDSSLPNLWRSATDPKTGRKYYFHAVSNKTVWNRPTHLTETFKFINTVIFCFP